MQDNIPLVSEDDVISPRGKKVKDTNKVIVKKEKPIRIIRIKCYDKILFPFMKDGKMGNKEAFAVNRGLKDLLKDLRCNTDMQGYITSSDCILVEKDNRISSNNRFIFIEISREEFPVLKRQLENHPVICAFNMGEFSVLEGGRAYLGETWNMPRIWKGGWKEEERQISDTNIILMRARLREELKDIFVPYHSYTDEQIDNMKESELIALKKLSNRKMAIENKKRKKIGRLLR